MNKLTTKQIRDIIAASAEASLAQVAELLAPAGIDVRVLAKAIAGNSAQLIGFELELE